MSLFPRTLSLTRSNGHHPHIILLLCLHQIPFLVKIQKQAAVLTAKPISHHPWSQCASGTTVMKTLTALVAPRITIQSERKFLLRFETDSGHMPYWAMLKIRVDPQEECNILVHAWITATLRRKAKEGQHCFITQDVKCHDKLEYPIQQWQTKAHAKKDKGLILLTVSALSWTDQDFYHCQKNHYQTIATVYTDWYTHSQTVSQTSYSTYFYCDS